MRMEKDGRDSRRWGGGDRRQGRGVVGGGSGWAPWLLAVCTVGRPHQPFSPLREAVVKAAWEEGLLLQCCTGYLGGALDLCPHEQQELLIICSQDS